jgi:UDP-3-O-[3-hydroxymyristoyl] glucosamine N-acyltransferase
MQIENLVSLDASIVPLKLPGNGQKIEGLTTFERLRPNHLLFLKEKKFLEKLNSNLNDPILKEMGLLVCQKFLEKIEKEPSWLEISSSLSFVLITSSFDKSITLLSKIYFDQEFAGIDFFKDGREEGSVKIDSSAKIAPNTFLGSNVKIGKNVKIHSGVRILANSTVEADSEIFPNCVIYPKVEIGKNCRIHANTTIGSDGFGYSFFEGAHNKLWHFGGVVISDNVEIGANSIVDGGTFSATKIGEGCKIDNSVQIAHNCQIGNKVILCGQVGISGSCKIGDYSLLAGKVGVGHNTTLGKNVQVGGGALVNCDWPDNSVISGYPARPLKEWLRGLAYLRIKSLKKE